MRASAPTRGCYGPKLKHCIKKVRLTAFMCLMATLK